MVVQIKLIVVVVVGRQLISFSLNEATPFALRNPIMDDTKAMEPVLEPVLEPVPVHFKIKAAFPGVPCFFLKHKSWRLIMTHLSNGLLKLS